MNKILFTMILGASLISTPAFADSSAGSQSGAVSGSNSSAGGGQGGQGGNASINLGSGAPGVAGVQGAGTTSTSGAPLSPVSVAGINEALNSASVLLLDQSDHSSTNIESSDLGDAVPSVFAAGVTAGGSNPCVVSIGGGVSVSGGGFNYTQAYNDGECQIRESLRLMVAILPNNADKGSQMLIRETACQSDVYWQSMERVYIKTQDDRFLCSNPRPDNKPIAIRDRAREQVKTTASLAPVKTQSVVSNFNSHPFLDF